MARQLSKLVLSRRLLRFRLRAVVPLMVGGNVWGAINLEELVENAFDDGDAQLLSILANQVAGAIRSAELADRLEQGPAYSA